jgi:hypothetical protein
MFMRSFAWLLALRVPTADCDDLQFSIVVHCQRARNAESGRLVIGIDKGWPVRRITSYAFQPRRGCSLSLTVSVGYRATRASMSGLLWCFARRIASAGDLVARVVNGRSEN